MASKLATPTTGPLLTCTPMRLPQDLLIRAAAQATAINPINHPPVGRLAQVLVTEPSKLQIAMLTTKKWHTVGVHLTVGFLDNPPLVLRKRILQHMNAWSKLANVSFKESKTDPQVRIARASGGYWSYLGTDILSIDADKPTLNLEAFTMNTPDSEFCRVVRHEAGHTLGFPHEHMRQELVALIDPKKAIAFFGATQGWTAAEVRAQVLTPLEVSSLVGTVPPDPHSIMCYQIPGSLTKTGQPIIGGPNIDDTDHAFAATMYPKQLTRK
jgi:hypothetical protein